MWDSPVLSWFESKPAFMSFSTLKEKFPGYILKENKRKVNHSSICKNFLYGSKDNLNKGYFRLLVAHKIKRIVKIS
jgi:hypothetical protein